MIRLVAVVAAISVLIGLLNLIGVHLGRFVRSEHGWPYSMVALISMLAVLVLRILDRAEIWPDDLEGEQMSERVFESVQVSLESALAAPRHVDASHGLVLTDDYNPVEYFDAPNRERTRRMLTKGAHLWGNP